MSDQILNHGLDQPLLGTNTGYFQVTFPEPGENLDHIRVPDARLTVTPAIEAQLNERQRKMLQRLAQGHELTSRACEAEFGVTRPVTASDLGKLVALGLAGKIGGGRSTRYRFKASEDSLGNRKGATPTHEPAEFVASKCGLSGWHRLGGGVDFLAEVFGLDRQEFETVFGG
jgi:hypothetical protein